MPAATDKIRPKTDVKEKHKRGGGRIGLILGVIVVIALVTGGGAWYLLGEDGKHLAHKPPPTRELPAPAQYFAMDPPFVVNLNGPLDGPRYLQVEIQLVSRNPEEAKLITDNAPAIRAHLLMLLSAVQSNEITDAAGRQKLRQSALTEAQRVMTDETGRRCVADLLFTNFLTQ